MRPTRLVTGAALGVAALGLAAPVAYAGDFGAIEVSPHPVGPGGTAALSTTGCERGTSAEVDAGALGAGTSTLTPRADAATGTLVGELTVKPGTAPGNYGIDGRCGRHGKAITGMVKVGSAQQGIAGPGVAGPGTGTAAAAGPGPGPYAGAVPGSALRTGAEGEANAAPSAAGPSSGTSATAEITAGTCALLAGLTAGVWGLHRRRADARR